MKNASVITICITILIIAIFFWPGLYVYDHVSEYHIPVRTNRITGTVEVFRGLKWVTSGKQATEQRIKSRPLTSTELSAITGSAGLENTGFVRGDLYNGSSVKITQLTFNVAAYGEKHKLIWQREITDSEWIEPHHTKDIIFQAGEAPGKTDFEWSIESGLGLEE